MSAVDKLQTAGEDVVHLLPLVGGEGDRGVLLRFDKRGGNHERFGNLVLERGGKMFVLEALAAFNRQSLALADNRTAEQMRLLAADNLN